jgi:cell division inhibitor SulA/protein ImuA
MSALPDRAGLEGLLQHPALWRGRSVAPLATIASGFEALDVALSGGGWPRNGLIEILTARPGLGELRLCLPMLASLTSAAEPRWSTVVSPPFQLFAPALVAAGVALERLLLLHPPEPLWSTEQALRSGACDLVLAWVDRAPGRDLRRLVLAAEQGRATAVLFRPAGVAAESSPAALRLLVQPIDAGLRVHLLKHRGAGRDVIDLRFPS